MTRQNSRFVAIRAPSAIAASFAHTTSSATRPRPAEVSKPQSVPARTRLRIAHRARDKLDAVGHHFGVLDEIGQRIDHAGDDDLIIVERQILQTAVLVRMARIGERQHEAADLGLTDGRQHLRQGHVAVVRALVVAPAGVQPHLDRAAR